MLTCLIVANNPSTRHEFATIVRALKFEAVCASSVNEATQALRLKPLVAIVVDEWWHNGEDPMIFVRKQPLLNRSPVVVVQKVRLTALNNGADYVVHRDDPGALGDILAQIELKAHEAQLAVMEPELQKAAE